MDANAIELGTRSDASGQLYGAGVPELVVACRVAVDASSARPIYTTRLFARYAAADPTAPPLIEQLADTMQDTVARVQAGDVNGDGLDDVVYTLGGETAHVLEQCDTHGDDCTQQGGP